MGVRTRFAPSPTGHLHIGSARTALFNWLFAKRFNGQFVLRIENTDIARSSVEFEKSIYEDLRWLGLDWDEGPDKGGGKGPYRQSERFKLYAELADGLLSKGSAYNCYCTKERLQEVKERQIASGHPPRYDGKCRDLKPDEIPQGVKPVIRFLVPEKTIHFTDGVHGQMIFDTRAFGDFVIIGSDGIAGYNFAVVVDDALMGITHIIRGDDHISNTPRQILLFEALGFTVPSFSHIPLVLAPDKTPLSKRHASASLKELREEGYLPEAIINTIARLGWNPGEEFLSLDALAKEFSIDRLSKSGSVFDTEKLKYYNKKALEQTDAGLIMELASIKSDGRTRDAVELVKANAVTIKDIRHLLKPFTGEPDFSDEARNILKEDYSKKVVKAFRMEAEKIDSFDEASYKSIIEAVKKDAGEKGKRLFMPIRSALTGEVEGIELVNVLKLLGRDKVIERLKKFE